VADTEGIPVILREILKITKVEKPWMNTNAAKSTDNIRIVSEHTIKAQTAWTLK
jgi:hypothetical protein